MFQELPYLDMVIMETLRRYPFQGLTSRVCTRDYFVPHGSTLVREETEQKMKKRQAKKENGFNGGASKGFVIPRGTEVLIHAAGIQADPKYYPEPEKFNPENFAPENVAKRQKYVSLNWY